MANNKSFLSQEDSVLLLDVFEESLQIRNRDQFFSWVQGSLQCLIPNEVLICGVSLKDQSQLHFESFISTRYVNDKHVRFVTNHEAGIVSRVIQAWKKDRLPILISHTLDQIDFGSYRVPFVESKEALNNLELKNIAAHGISNNEGDVITFFSFSRISGEPSPKHAYILQLLVPQMHHALLRSINNSSGLLNISASIDQKQQKQKIEKQIISSREAEVLHWVCLGKTNSEISDILGVSVNTIKNHVHNVIAKLGVENRSQACNMANKLGILR